ncbi:glycosyl transferase [Actinocrispum wychmicini]|uniref:Glycosyl transferase n=1 Tax=Actinocrispum wychmicini TaxID=1213861 RepID=A0A4R2JM53_9PSEU|nr:glycosyl transferase [Actinocrispum wychmicini]TCO58158.1 hypothetical protein EV192_105223 [Actinocrispum wychmicini]
MTDLGQQEVARRTRLTAVDAAVFGGYLLAAILLFGRMWTDLDHGYLLNSMQDQNLFEWYFAVAAHNPGTLVSTMQNYPAGVNLMANTSVLGLGIPLAPVTWLFGTTVTWTLALTLSVAGSAAGWYWVISRHITGSRPGAAVGGAFAAFAPPMISHANAHPNYVALFVLPFIVGQLIKLVRGQNAIRNGIILGLLLTYQVFLGEEPLLMAATALLIFGIARPSVWNRSLLTGLGIAALTAVPLLAYPLWTQFFGPQSYSGMFHGPAGNDLAAITGFASASIAGDPTAQRLAVNPTEENAFFGYPLVILVVVLTVWLWKVANVRALMITCAAMALLSLGGTLVINRVDTEIPLPWQFVHELPIYDSAIGSRLTMACVPAIGILLALATERILTLAAHATHTPLRLLWVGALLAVLVPITPVPLEVVKRQPTPAFFANGVWQDYVGKDRSVVFVPLASTGYSLPLYWQARTGLGFPLAEGYFTGPDKKGKGTYGAVPRPTSTLIDNVARTGIVPPIGEDERAQAQRDLQYWHAGAVVLAPHDRQDALRQTCDALFGDGRYVGGVWLWTVPEVTQPIGS